jgi:hypothetical protein
MSKQHFELDVRLIWDASNIDWDGYPVGYAARAAKEFDETSAAEFAERVMQELKEEFTRDGFSVHLVRYEKRRQLLDEMTRDAQDVEGGYK